MSLAAGTYCWKLGDRMRMLENRRDRKTTNDACLTPATVLLQARIYTSARTAGQQGLANTIYNNKGRPWRIGFETQEK